MLLEKGHKHLHFDFGFVPALKLDAPVSQEGTLFEHGSFEARSQIFISSS